jgi:hypothetical protein
MAMVFQAGSAFHVSRRANSFVVLCVGLLQELTFPVGDVGYLLGVVGGASGSAKRSAIPGPVLINNDRLSSSCAERFSDRSA